ncbi:MAG: cohesin domain-containing protein, partial [Desulfuromonadales bacterium]
AVEKYFAATQDDPGNKTYKLKLIAGRTRAAAFHIDRARKLTREDRLEEALAQYRLARGFDPSVEVAALEARELQQIVDARRQLEEGFVRYREKRYAAARQIARDVLKIDPQNDRAKELLKLLDARYQAVVMDGIELDIASNEPITLRFKQANVKEVFGILTKLSGINFLLDDEIKDKPITILLEKATFSQAMELVISMAGLNKKVLNSKTMIIYPQNKEKNKQYEDQIIQSFYLSHIDAKKAVNLLRTMLQLRKVYVHEERNALVIRDTPDTIRLAEQVLLAADRENSEVIFDLEILAVSNTDALRFGPRRSTDSISVGFADGSDATQIVADALSPGSKVESDSVTSGTTTTFVGGAIQSLNNLQTFYTLPTITFDLAKTLTGTEILASPKIRVRNSEKAKVHIGTREPVITVTTTGDTSTDNIQYVDVGVKVDVEPTIQLNQTVQTKLSLEVSQVIDRVTTTNGSVALTISTTNAQSVLTLKDGVQTIIGGLFEQNSSKTKRTIPFLGEIPLFGNLISNLDKNDNKREILLSITPYIVKQIEVPETDVATIWSGGEDELMARPKFGAFAQPLLSEVESTSPATAPGVARPGRPAASAAVPWQAAPVPGGADAAGQIPAPPAGPADVPMIPDASPPVPASAPAIPVTQAVPPNGPPAGSLLTQPSPAEAPSQPAVPGPAVPVPAPEPVVALVAPAEPPAPVQEPPIVLPLPPKGPARLSITGAEAAAAGQEFTLAIQVSGIDRLYSAPLFVNYDPALLEFVDSKEGTFLGQGGQTTVFSYSPNTVTGQVVVGYKQGVGGAGVSGDGSLFTLRFRAKAAGTARVELNRINFRDPAGTRLAVEPTTASITIR